MFSRATVFGGRLLDSLLTKESLSRVAGMSKAEVAQNGCARRSSAAAISLFQSWLMILSVLTLAWPANLAAQTAHFSYAQTALAGGFASPHGVAVDQAGNIFVADTTTGVVKEIPVGCMASGCVKTLGSGFSAPQGVAVDSAGNVFVADTGNNAVKEILSAGGYTTVNTLGSGFSSPDGVAVDGSGTVFVADTGNNAIKRIPATGGYVTVYTLGSGFSAPRDVAVDGSANIYVADSGNNAIKELPSAGGYNTVNILGGGFNAPAGIAVDGIGNVYVADTVNNVLKEIPSGCASASCVVITGSSFNAPSGVALDANGNLYIADAGNNRLIKQQTTAVDFGSVAIGQMSAVISLTFTFDSSGIIGSPAGLTLGATGQDFVIAASSTCTAGASFSAGSTCTIDATFTPRFAGTRFGAATLDDGSGSVIATGYIHGAGLGPQVSFLPYSQAVLGTTGTGGAFALPVSVAVDGSGNVFVADYSNQIKEIPAGCTATNCVKSIGSGFNQAASVAVDGAGNVFVADTYNNAVKEILAAGGYVTVKTLGGAFDTPQGIAVDASGNVFVANTGSLVDPDTSNSAIKEILAAGGYVTVKTLGGSYRKPESVAVDGSGNVFVSDDGNGAIKEILAAGGYTTVNTLAGIYNAPGGLAVDGVGNVYVPDTNTATLKEILAAGGYITVKTLVTYTSFPANGVAVDGSGNIYTAIPGDQVGIVKLDYSDAPSLTFATTTVGTTDTADGTPLVTLQNIGNMPLTVSGFAPPAANFNTPTPPTNCSAPSTIAPGSTCDVGVVFAPTAPGTLTGTITFTDNALNVAGATQQAHLSGVAETAAAPPAPTITSSPANPTDATTAVFTFNDTQASVTFICSLDGAAYTACVSGVNYSGLTHATHTFSVKAQDALSNLSAATTYTWAATAPPIPSIDSAPANPTTTTSATFTFSDTQTGVSFICSLDGAAYTACTSPAAYSSLAVGAHTFAVEAKDSLNAVGSPATYNWTVSATLGVQSGSGQDFGTVAVGQTSAAISMTYTFTGSETLVAPVALTQGSPGLDFVIGSASTCTSGASYSAGNTCTLSVTFMPKFPGVRNGALLLKDTSGNAFATIYVHGTGSGPQVRFLSGLYNSPTAKTLLGGGFRQPNGIAIDGAGDVFVADFANSLVKEIPAGCVTAGCVQTLGGGFSAPRGVAVDSAGNVFVADWGNGRVKELPAGCASAGCVTVIGGGFTFSAPYGLSVDGSGNIFLADLGNHAVYEILAAGGYTTVASLGSGFAQPEDVAVDGSGNVFVVDTGITSNAPCGATVCASTTVALREIVAAGGYTTVNTLAQDFNAPIYVAVDPTGNVYVTEFLSTNGSLQEFFAADGYSHPLDLDVACTDGAYCSGTGAAIDGSGAIYIANDSPGVNSVTKFEFGTPPPIAYPTPIVVGQTDTIDNRQGVTVENIGNTALTLDTITASTNFFVAPAAGSPPCSTSSVVNPGNSCGIVVVFAPTTSGPVTGTLTVTDNNLNASGTTQVNLSGIGILDTPVLTSGPANPSDATTATFTFTDSQTTGVTFLCSLDNAAFATCSSGVAYFSLAPGTHTFAVEAQAGVNTSPARSYSWVINTPPPPDPTITSGPANPTTATSAAFAFTDTQAGVTFYCSLDNAAFTVCSTGIAYSSLAIGTHTFAVAVADSTGTVSGTVGYVWTVISGPPPDPIITSEPANPTTDTTATFAFTDSQPGVTFHCILDFNFSNITTCTSGVTYTAFAVGSHSFSVYATDSTNNASNFVTYSWTVVHPVSPQPAITSGAFSTVAIGQTSAPISLSFTFTGNTTLGSIAGLAQGAPNQDFAVVSGGTCAVGSSYTAGNSCSISVTFAPKSAGMRKGAVVLQDTTGKTVGLGYVHGIGSGPQISFLPQTQTSLGGAFQSINNIAIDGNGNVFVTDFYTTSVTEIPVGCTSTSCHKTVGGGLLEPTGVAVDGAGNVFVEEPVYGLVKEIPPGCATAACVLILNGTFSDPVGLTVDGDGNVYVGGSTTNFISKLTAADGYTTAITLPLPVNDVYGDPRDIAIDSTGNIFVAELQVQAFKEIPAGCTTAACGINVFTASTLPYPQHLSMDQTGSIFITNSPGPTGSVFELSAANGYTVPVPVTTGLAYSGVAVDSGENLFLGDYTDGKVIKLDYADAPTLNFATTTAGGSTDTTDGPQKATIKNVGNSTLSFSSIAASTNFTIDAGTTTCSTSTPLAVGASCVVGAIFTPTGGGTLTGAITLTDNVFNVTGATQQITLTGIATGAPAKVTPTVIVTPSPTSITTAQALTVTIVVSESPTPTGSVTLTSGSFTSAATTLISGGASITVPAGALSAGTDTLSVTYTPDSSSSATYNGATGTNTVAVTTPAKTTPTVTVTPAPSSITTAQALTVTIAVSGSPTPTGSVTLTSGSFTSAATTLVSSGASISIPAGTLPTGNDTLSATYTPDSSSSTTYNSATGTNTVTVTAATVQVTVGTNPAALSFTVDGTAYSTTQTLTWNVGSIHTIAATSPQVASGIQNTFASWSDEGALSHSVAAPSSATSYTATFTTAYQLTTAANPTTAGTITPASGTFYPSGTTVNLSATPSSGYAFSNWTPGNVASPNNASTTIIMSAPQSVTANFTTAAAPIAGLAPSSLSFTAITGVTTTPQTVTLSNTGNAPLAITSIGITGTNPSAFSQTNPCGASLAAGSNCTISITFTPSSATTFAATLSVVDNASGSPQTIALSGTGSAAPTFSIVSPTGAQTVQAGGIAQYTINVTAQNGAFSNAVTLTASGLPPGAVATFMPPSLTPGSASAGSQLSIQTARTSSAMQRRSFDWQLASPMLPLFGLFLAIRKRRRPWAKLAIFLLASFSAITALTGCGGGFAAPGSASPTYTITITGTSATVQQTTTVQLTIQ